ncbi:MAG: T9SS type A sorting domain-containing protein [Bacteroidota bacterium]
MKNFALSVFFTLAVISLKCQVLNLPPRLNNMPAGSDFVSIITNLSQSVREDTIYNHVVLGNVPDFQRNLIPVTAQEIVGNDTFNITYYVLPDYLAIGCDTDYFLCPMTPVLAQRIAFHTGCTLPTRKMVNEIYFSSTAKLAPQPLPPGSEMTTVPYFSWHNDTVWYSRNNILSSHPLGELVGGDKKDIVVSNLIYSSGTDRVVIYGWHLLSGVPIQGLYNGHILEYVDYSHGVRLVQNNAIVNDDTLLITDILQNPAISSLFSDEGTISVPWYPVPVIQVEAPESFAVLIEDETSVRVVVDEVPGTNFIVQAGDDGLIFPEEISLNLLYPVIEGLIADQIKYFRIIAESGGLFSQPSEVLAARPGLYSNNILVVNSFDRNSDGNTHNFIRQHGEAISSVNYYFSSATNEALTDSLILLSNFQAIDFILGEESSVDETFNVSEQEIVKDYLINGGKMFLSGAEIGWDLDHLGSSTDKEFYNEFLKAQYVFDAPDETASTYYSVSTDYNGIFTGISDFMFDNGLYGTYNVDWPDVIEGINGGYNCLNYVGVTNQTTGIQFEGFFPGGVLPGKLVYFGFPFETIYPEVTRNEIMSRILDFFFGVSSNQIANMEKDNIRIYPNPAESFLYINSQKSTEIKIFDTQGRLIYLNNIYTGISKINVEEWERGIYFIKTDSKTMKIALQ